MNSLLTTVIIGLAFVSCVSASGTILTSTGFPSISSLKCFGATIGTDSDAANMSEIDVCIVGVISALVLAIGLYPGFVPKFDAPFRRRNDIAAATPTHFYNPYLNENEPQKASRVDYYSQSLKDKLSRAYDSLTESLSQSELYKKASSSIRSAATSSTQSKLVAPESNQRHASVARGPAAES